MIIAIRKTPGSLGGARAATATAAAAGSAAATKQTKV